MKKIKQFREKESINKSEIEDSFNLMKKNAYLFYIMSIAEKIEDQKSISFAIFIEKSECPIIISLFIILKIIDFSKFINLNFRCWHSSSFDDRCNFDGRFDGRTTN